MWGAPGGGVAITDGQSSSKGSAKVNVCTVLATQRINLSVSKVLKYSRRRSFQQTLLYIYKGN